MQIEDVMRESEAAPIQSLVEVELIVLEQQFNGARNVQKVRLEKQSYERKIIYILVCKYGDPSSSPDCDFYVEAENLTKHSSDVCFL